MLARSLILFWMKLKVVQSIWSSDFTTFKNPDLNQRVLKIATNLQLSPNSRIQLNSCRMTTRTEVDYKYFLLKILFKILGELQDKTCSFKQVKIKSNRTNFFCPVEPLIWFKSAVDYSDLYEFLFFIKVLKRKKIPACVLFHCHIWERTSKPIMSAVNFIFQL